MERLTDVYKGWYGIKTQEGIMPAYEIALGKRTAAAEICMSGGKGYMKKLCDKARMYARSYGQPPYGREIEGTAELLLQMADKLEEYEDLEEQGKLLKLPCAVGDTVYVIPSETNYKLNIINGHSENNRVYEQVVNRIEISNTGYLLVTCDGMASVVDTFYKKTWFLTKEEAEAALKGL